MTSRKKIIATRTMGTTATSATLSMGRAGSVVRAAIFRRGGIAIHGGDERRRRCRRVGAGLIMIKLFPERKRRYPYAVRQY